MVELDDCFLLFSRILKREIMHFWQDCISATFPSHLISVVSCTALTLRNINLAESGQKVLMKCQCDPNLSHLSYSYELKQFSLNKF